MRRALRKMLEVVDGTLEAYSSSAIPVILRFVANHCYS
jgi:hypothetical protein